MARIRTIKPEFFTSEDIASLTPLARLLYIALWCEADREGRLDWKPGTFKLRYFPADNCDISELASELIERKLVIIYHADGNVYAEIPTFKTHQVINNRESESTRPARVNDASTTRESGREGKGREGKEGTINTPNGVFVGNDVPSEHSSAKTEIPDCPHQDIISLYAEIIPNGIQPRVWDGTRAASLKTRWREDKKRQSMDYWRRFFVYLTQSPFLMGKVHDSGKRPFEISLDWIVKAENFAKIIEGKYHSERAVANG